MGKCILWSLKDKENYLPSKCSPKYKRLSIWDAKTSMLKRLLKLKLSHKLFHTLILTERSFKMIM